MKNIVKKIFDKTFLKFIIVGIINTLFGTGIMFVLYNLVGCNYWISSMSNYIFGSIISYFLNKYYTFQNTDKSFKVILKFVVNISCCYFIAYGIAKPLVRIILQNASKKIQENMAMLVGMGLFVVLNYLGQRFFTFKNSKND